MKHLAAVALVACSSATAEPPPHSGEIAGWATTAGYRLTDFKRCTGIEEANFGALGSVCWSARSRTPRPADSRMFPRMDITMATFTDAAAAKVRLDRFRVIPKALERGPREKVYPLRAGFRLGTRVVVITTDAYAFEPDVRRAAAELAKATGGTDLVCWQRCAP